MFADGNHNKPTNMKILKQGAIPPEQLPWWAQIVFRCAVCETEFQLDINDMPNIGGERHPGGAQWASEMCPVCKRMITEVRKSANAVAQTRPTE